MRVWTLFLSGNEVAVLIEIVVKERLDRVGLCVRNAQVLTPLDSDLDLHLIWPGTDLLDVFTIEGLLPVLNPLGLFFDGLSESNSDG